MLDEMTIPSSHPCVPAASPLLPFVMVVPQSHPMSDDSQFLGIRAVF
jgi:hypothetical protein